MRSQRLTPFEGHLACVRWQRRAPTPIGPTNRPVRGSATLQAVAHTKAFDPAVTPDTGDFWEFASNPSAVFSPLLLNPGQGGTITVTFTPSGPKGTKVSGVLYVGTASDARFSADELAAFAYSYTVN